MMRNIGLLLFFAVLLLGSVAPAQAHGYVVRSIPEDRSTLERSPTRLQYWFSEGLEPEFSGINLRDQEGNVLASGGVDEQDDTLLTLRVPPQLPDGAYIVELRPAFASDGHVIVETRVFFVGEEVRGVQGQAASDAAEPFEVLWKTVLFNATYLLFGTVMLYRYVLVPVWGNTKYPRGLLPPRLMQRLNVVLLASILLAAFANMLGLLQQTMVFFGVPLELVLEGNLWEVVRIGSRFGDVWNFRMGALLLLGILLGASLYYGEKYPRTVRSFWTAMVWVAALLLGGQAVTSHAAGSLVMPWLGIALHWLHVLAVGFWVGGILALVLILPVALAPYDEASRWQALRPLMKRFSRYVVGALLLVIATGIYSATNWFFTPGDFLTTYGAALGYKLLMVALLVIVGGLHHVALRPHLLKRVPLQGLVTWAQKFRGSLRLEMLVVVLTLTLAALLSATPIPEPEFLRQDVETPSQTAQVGDITVQVTISPGGTGVNTFDTLLLRDETPVNDAQVALQWVAPERGERSPWQEAEFADDGLYVMAGDQLDKTGRWWLLLDIAEGDRSTRAAFEWQITQEANLLQSLPPSLWTVLAALLTLAAFLYVLWPGLRQLAARMEWTALNVAVSLGAIVMSVGLLWGSIIFLEQQYAAQQAQLNPPPQRVNPTLPTAESLERGAALYEAHCTQWNGHEDYPALLNQLEFLRDEALFQATRRGWRDLPSCAGDLSEAQRWDLVNHIRSRGR